MSKESEAPLDPSTDGEDSEDRTGEPADERPDDSNPVDELSRDQSSEKTPMVEPDETIEFEEGTAGEDVDIGRRKRRLDERELGLGSRSEELDERERELDEREQALDNRADELEAKRQELQEWESALNDQQAELDTLEEELNEFSEELSERSAELGEHEETLHQYMESQVEDLEGTITGSMMTALDEWEDRQQEGRYGTTGIILLGLSGVVLSACGVGYAAWVQFGATGGFFGTVLADISLAAALLIIGVTLNIVSMTSKS